MHVNFSSSESEEQRILEIRRTLLNKAEDHAMQGRSNCSNMRAQMIFLKKIIWVCLRYYRAALRARVRRGRIIP
jgi:hypothetical protein